jgi:hypothetical protein
MAKAKEAAERRESKQKQYQIDVRSIVENHNPRDPLPAAVRQQTLNNKPYGLFTGDTSTIHFRGDPEPTVIKLDVWQLGTSDDATERSKYCELMERDPEFVAWATTFLTVGQVMAVEVRDNGKKGDGGNTYTLIDGCRRCLAILYNWCKLGGKGVPWVGTTLSPKLNQTGLLHRSIVANTRQNPNPMEGARAIQMAVNQGQDVAEVAATYGRSETWVRTMLKLLELPAPVQKQVAERTVAVSKALEQAASEKAKENGAPPPARKEEKPDRPFDVDELAHLLRLRRDLKKLLHLAQPRGTLAGRSLAALAGKINRSGKPLLAELERLLASDGHEAAMKADDESA